MKAKELMIWDWVNLRNGRVLQPHQVTCIGFSTLNRKEIGTSICLDLSDEFPTCIFSMDVVEPILLTAEILEKNGFIKYGTSYILKESMFELTNPSNPDRYLDNYYIRLARQNKRVMYVHELQHFMRLFGIKEEIEL